MGKINILNDAGTNKLTLDYNGSTDQTINTEHLTGTTSNIQSQLGAKADSTDVYTKAESLAIAGRRNLIINGGFDVWQRATDAQGNYGYIAPDRWALTYSTGAINLRLYRQASNSNVMDSSYHLGIASMGATIPAGANQRIETRFEKSFGFMADGATYRPVTLSFWMRSPQNNTLRIDGGYSVDSVTVVGSSNWQKFTYTYTNSPLNKISFYFTNGEVIDVEISQIQLELGSVATPFEHRSYGEELALCQRFYQIHYVLGSGVQNSATSALVAVHLPTTMRTVPSVYTRSGGWTNINVEHDDTYDVTSIGVSHGINNNGKLDELSSFIADVNTSGSNTTGYGVCVMCDRNSDYFIFDSEL
jgi:hypothetical protein